LVERCGGRLLLVENLGHESVEAKIKHFLWCLELFCFPSTYSCLILFILVDSWLSLHCAWLNLLISEATSCLVYSDWFILCLFRLFLFSVIVEDKELASKFEQFYWKLQSLFGQIWC
jgi:hypothetical protein